MRELIQLVEAKKSPKDIEIVALSYDLDDLRPVISQRTMDYHYGKLAHGYADRFNRGEGDPEFNYAGAVLHNIYFTQFRKPRGNNRPNGPVGSMIDSKFGSWDDFKTQFHDTAMAIQGSGWAYLSREGTVKTIANHETRTDILLLVDWWEHAWALDYQADKATYLRDLWQVIDWNVINSRWGEAYR